MRELQTKITFFTSNVSKKKISSIFSHLFFLPSRCNLDDKNDISVRTDLTEEGANSTLSVARINKLDSGKHSCKIC